MAAGPSLAGVDAGPGVGAAPAASPLQP